MPRRPRPEDEKKNKLCDDDFIDADEEDEEEWVDMEDEEECFEDDHDFDDDGDDEHAAGAGSNNGGKKSAPAAGPDLYQLIGVPRDAPKEDVARAYRRQALKCHPDLNPDGTELFKQLAAAYEVLSDPKRRAVYDRTGETSEGAAEGVPTDEAARSFEVSETLRTFMEAFRDSEEEIEELAHAFAEGGGSLPHLLQHFMWTNEEGELARVARLVNESVLPAVRAKEHAGDPAAKKQLAAWAKSSSVDKLAALNKKYDKERREAEEALRAYHDAAAANAAAAAAADNGQSTGSTKKGKAKQQAALIQDKKQQHGKKGKKRGNDGNGGNNDHDDEDDLAGAPPELLARFGHGGAAAGGGALMALPALSSIRENAKKNYEDNIDAILAKYGNDNKKKKKKK